MKLNTADMGVDGKFLIAGSLAGMRLAQGRYCYTNAGAACKKTPSSGTANGGKTSQKRSKKAARRPRRISAGQSGALAIKNGTDGGRALSAPMMRV
ncbi:hypothetical protein ACFIQF_00235 [Comamonas sp. J-3]|uniref:hypothetical protein n=1 Tax=Comamonas trifloxystrobinivorans TaxID=3350256 RepID=UPI00372B24A4